MAGYAGACRGMAGKVGRGLTRRGTVRRGRHGVARQVWARYGWVRLGTAWQAWQGGLRIG